MVLVEAASDGAPMELGFESAPKRAKNDLLLAASGVLTPREKGAFTVITRSRLSSSGKDPKAMVSALKNIIKQDRVQGIAQKKRRAADAAQEPASQDGNEEEEEDVQDEDEDSDRPDTIEIKGLADELKLNLEELCVGGVNDDPFEPTEEDIEAARTILEIDAREGAADKIYLLDGFPATKAEGDAMVSAGLDGVLDAVIKVYAEDSLSRVRLRGYEPPPSEGNLSRSSSRASMHSLQVSTKAFADETEREHIIDILKQAAATAEGPGWGDVAFLEIPVKAGNPLVELPSIEEKSVEEYKAPEFVRDFMKTIGDVAFEKYRFRKYLSMCDHVAIGSNEWGKHAGDEDKQHYDNLLACIPEVCYSAPIILDCVVATVVRNGEKNETAPPEVLSSLTGKATLSPRAAPADHHRLITAKYHDHSLIRQLIAHDEPWEKSSCPAPEIQGERLPDIERRYWKLLPIPGGRNRRGMPREPVLNAAERGIRMTEFQTFANASAEEIYHVQTCDVIDEIMARADDAKAASSVSRVWKEALSSEEIVQTFASELIDEPEVYAKYFAPNDKMVALIHRRTPVGRSLSLKRSAFAHTNLRPTFSMWPNMNLNRREKCFDVDAGPLHALEHRVQCLYPGDHSIVRVYNIPKKKRAWCTVYKNGHLFGMRAPQNAEKLSRYKANFVAQFKTNSCLHVKEGPKNAKKPDGFGSVTVTNTCASGLVVEHCSDGSVRQFFASKSERIPPQARQEVSRVIVGGGSVVRLLATGEQEILYANGDVAKRSRVEAAASEAPKKTKIKTQAASPAYTEWKVTSFGRGGCQYTKGADGERKNVESADVESYLDAETSERVQIMKCDERVVIGMKDGSVLAIHHDGTRMLSYSDEDGSARVIVECDGYASVAINTDVDKNAALHSSGGRIDISHGGYCKRSSSLLPDGTVVDIEYDTRITATVNGIVRTQKTDGTTILAKDDGTVRYTPGEVASRLADVAKEDEERSTPRDARATRDDSVDCFYVSCIKNRMEIVDEEHNAFRVEYATNYAKQSVNVDLGGEMSPVEAVINEPIAPRMFVLNGDGTGEELLRPQTVSAYRRMVDMIGDAGVRVVKPSNLSSVAGRSAGMPGRSHVFVHELRGTCWSSASAPPGITQELPPSIRAAKEWRKSDELVPSAKIMVTRNLCNMDPISSERMAMLRKAQAQYGEWMQEQEAMEDRFAVNDDRHQDDINAERKVQRKIMKEYRKIMKAERRRLRAERKAGKKTSKAKFGMSSMYSIASSASSLDSSFYGGVGNSMHAPPPSLGTLGESGLLKENNEQRSPVIDGIDRIVEHEGSFISTPRGDDSAVVSEAIVRDDAAAKVRPPTPPRRLQPFEATAGSYWSHANAVQQPQTLPLSSDQVASSESNDNSIEENKTPKAQAEPKPSTESPRRFPVDPSGVGDAGKTSVPITGLASPAASPPPSETPTAFYTAEMSSPAAGAARNYVASKGGRTVKGRAADFDVIGNPRKERVRAAVIHRKVADATLRENQSASMAMRRSLNTCSTGVLPASLHGSAASPEDLNNNDGSSAQIYPAALAFGNIAIGESASLDVYIRNVDNQILKYNARVDVEDASGNAIAMKDSRCSLAPGMRTAISISIAGKRAGAVSASCILTTEDASYCVPVTAMGGAIAE